MRKSVLLLVLVASVVASSPEPVQAASDLETWSRAQGAGWHADTNTCIVLPAIDATVTGTLALLSWETRSNYGYIGNDGEIYDGGTIYNDGTIHNDGTIANYGTINNYSAIDNYLMSQINGANPTIWVTRASPFTHAARNSRPNCVERSGKRFARVWRKYCPTRRGQIFPPQIVTGAAIAESVPQKQMEQAATRSQVVRALALDLQYALSRRGRSPFVMSGLPMFDDLCALRQTLAQRLALGEDPHLCHWHAVLNGILPSYTFAFAQVRQALDWVDEVERILDVPLPTVEEPGPGGDAVALEMAHYLGQLADVTDLSPWLMRFRNELLALSKRYSALGGLGC